MPEYLAPGVFVEEMDSGSKPIEGVGTNTAAFIGYAKSGEFNKPTFITNWTQFANTFGEDEPGYLKALSAVTGRSYDDILDGKIASKKSWAEFSRLLLLDEGKTPDEGQRKYGEFVVKNRELLNVSPYMYDENQSPVSYLAHSIRGFFDNSGGRAYVVRVARPEDLAALSTKSASSNGTGGSAAPEPLHIGGVTLKALNPGGGGDVKVEVKHAGDDGFTVNISQGPDKESFGSAKEPIKADGFAAAVSTSKIVAAEQTATATKPEAKTFTIEVKPASANLPAKAGAAALALPTSLRDLAPNDFTGQEQKKTGLTGFLPIDDINMICVPDLMAGVFKRKSKPITQADGTKMLSEERLDLSEAAKKRILDAQCGVVGFCEKMMDRMAIIDPLPGLNPLEMKQITNGTAYNCDHGQAAIYYPWIKVADPINKGQQIFVPPSGHLAGVYARVGVERGVHKAPANEALVGAVALETYVTKGEQEILNPDGINCIRSFPGTGIRVWGARTLATVGNPSWKYVNVRRLFNYLEKSMERGSQWVVFEPNDHDLWGRVRRNLSAFLWTCWKEGMLFGETPGEAFYVKCDAETNPQEMIDLGRLYVEIGVNPVKPAEFVIIRIGQWSAGGAMAET